ncbi:repeat:Kinesin light chain, partial [Candidatus Thiomargarita nelsonii]
MLGEKHPDTLESLGNLAMIYYEFGRESDALPLSEKGYRLMKEVLGEKHPETLTSLNNLAVIYQDLGRLSDALPLLEKSY